MNDLVKQDAQEYGRHIKQGGWRMGLLVARCVEKGKGTGRPPKGVKTSSIEKVSAVAFSKSAGTSDDRVLRHLDAWNKAAEAGVVPDAAKLKPGSDPRIDWDALPDWSDFYTSVTGGHNRFDGENLTAEVVKSLAAKLPAKEQATVAAEILDNKEVIEAADDAAEDHIISATTKLVGEQRGKTKKAKPNRGMKEISVVLELMGVLGQIRDLARENSDSPLIKECKNLMRETLEILDGIEQADDPGTVEQMFSDFGDLLSSQ